MRKTIALFVAVASLALYCAPKPALSQENPALVAKTKPLQPFRLDFSFSELEAEKKINTRHYTMNLTAGEANEIKIGTRVPVETGGVINSENTIINHQFQYMDVGTNVWAQIKERGDDLDLVVRTEISDLDKLGDRPGGLSNPIIRQMKFSGDTLLVIGKPMLIGVVDDPNSKRQFQLEVTATKLR